MRVWGWTLAVLGLAASLGILAFAAREAAYQGALTRRSPWAIDRLVERNEARLAGKRIHTAHVSIVLDPYEGAFRAEATLGVEMRGPGPGVPVFLLNESIRVESVWVDGKAHAFRREGLLLAVEAAVPAGMREVRVVYRHDPSPRLMPLGRISGVDVILPALGLWYPVDLQDSHTFTGEARLPADMQLITTGKVLERRRTPTREIVRWAEGAPVFAAPLVAGVAVREGLPGSVRHFALGPQDLPGLSPRWREDAGRLDAYLRSTLGDPGFGPLLLVQTAAVARPEPVGAGVLLVPSGFDTRGHAQLVALARGMARVWWGDTVTGRWFTPRAEGGRWLTEALPQYYALRALEALRGEAARLQVVDAGDRPWRPESPLRERPLREALAGGMPDEAFLWHGAQAASLMAAFAKESRFDAGAKRFLSVHRGRSVGVDAFLSELALAGERQFPAGAGAWLDTAGAADPALASVVAGQDEVHLRVLVPGGARPLPPVEVALFTAADVRIHRVDANGARGAITLPTVGPVERVVLDPHFRLPDSDRRNNVWPGPVWPGGLAAHAGGALAIGLRGAANRPEIDTVLLTQTVPGVEQRVGLTQPADPAMAWSADGAQLAFGGAALQVWTQAGGARITRGEGAILLGWDAGGTCWAHDARRGQLVNAATGGLIGNLEGAEPLPLSLRAVPDGGGQVALLRDGSLATWLGGGGAVRRISPLLSAVGDAGWSAALEAWIAVDRARGLVAVGADGDERTLLALPYAVDLARVAPDGAHAAWRDPAGKVRIAAVANPVPVAAATPGEVVDFAWQGAEAVVVLAREVSAVLPSPFHATASVWRVEVADGAAHRLGTLAAGPDGGPYLRRGR